MPERQPRLPPLCEILPHAGPVLLLHEFVAHDGDETRCRVVVGEQRWLRRADGTVPVWVGLEYMAQCCAAHSAYSGRLSGRSPGMGVLAGARSVRFAQEAFDPEDVLLVRARRIRGRPELGALVFACDIRHDEAGAEGGPLAEAALTVAVVREKSVARVP